MSPLLHAPSEEVLALARALIDRGTTAHDADELVLDTDDPGLQTAVRRVVASFDAYDERLMRRAAEEPDSMVRTTLELAIAHRIVYEQLVLAGDRAEAGADEPAPDPPDAG